ncbi:YobI family P-loop NTPase [Arthrobacter sp. KNU40]|uniref:YobI family P-loop NTPase n=1 Tax=Arthrobacter sp. KNU40 TaxID=3447965 RepID=UPI003F618759
MSSEHPEENPDDALVTDDSPGTNTEDAASGSEGQKWDRFSIHSLRPAFDPESHELYVHYLKGELNRPARMPKRHGEEREVDELRPCNIALTGSYGSGKSSILSKVVEDFSGRVVGVSLSTLGSEEVETRDDSAKNDPLATPAITNAIQKEIVKQLLYREKPSSVPGSRYRRIEGFRRGRAFGFSALLASSLTTIALLTGATSKVQSIFDNALWPAIFIYAGVFVLVLAMAQGLQALLHNRVWIEKLTSGPASISLTNNAGSFFDQYLDELVYFFEANPYDVVVFEDIDRFNDPYIFETLRELNTLLNNSKQIAPKRITFVYAIKDSIFEQLGKISINGVKLTAQEIQQLAVTNRTKFFDVVIPVVPFISHRNARDLISKEMKSSGFEIGKPLLDILSAYLVDMRLIKNIHNEFGIFAQKILATGHLDELQPQPLFAMIVYKNLSMTDFEKVKEGTSRLDGVWRDFRKLVNTRIAAAEQEARLARSRKGKLELVESRAEILGNGLEEYMDRLLRSAGQSLDNASITLSSSVTLAQLREPGFWESWLGNESLTLTLEYQVAVQVQYNQGRVKFQLNITLDDLRKELDDPLNLEEWKTADARMLQTTIEDSIDLREFLKTATMQQLAERHDIVLETEHGFESFSAIAERHLGKGLTFDLIRAGYIDRNFSLYVSLYYDDTVTARARNFILHSVDAGTVDINAEIGTGPQIAAMLDEVGDGIFNERSIYNIQLLDYLLASEDARLDRSMPLIGGDREEDFAIRTAYFASGHEQAALVTRLTPSWTGILEFLVTDESVAEEERSELLDIAFSALSAKHRYLTSPVVRDFIQSNYLKMKALVGGREVNSLEMVVAVLKDASVTFASLSSLSVALRPSAVENSLYELTEANLTAAIDGETNLALDNLRAASESIFAYAAANLSAYLEIQASSVTTSHTIASYKNFTGILNSLANRDLNDVLKVAERSSGVIVNKIANLDEKLWPIVAQTGKLAPNYSNVASYIEKVGSIDMHLATTLKAADEITELESVAESDKISLALTLLTTNQLNYEKRVPLAVSLGLEAPLSIADINLAGEDAGMAGAVLAAGLVEDSATAFEGLAAAPWPVKSSYIQASEDFVGYVRSVDFSADDFASLVQDNSVSDEIKETIVLNLSDFGSSTRRVALDVLARFAASKALTVGAANLLVMAAAGVDATPIVKLIALEIDSLVLDDVLEVLRLMPERYRKLTTTGGHTKLPLTNANLKLVDHLVAVRQVSSRDPNPTGSEFRVNLRRG